MLRPFTRGFSIRVLLIVFKKKTNKQKAKDVFSVSDTGGSEGKIRVPPIKSQTYDLVTIQPDALPLSYRPNDE